LAVEILKSHDIEAFIQADDAGGMRPDLVMHTGGVRLLVYEADSEKAKEILDSFDEAESNQESGRPRVMRGRFIFEIRNRSEAVWISLSI